MKKNFLKRCLLPFALLILFSACSQDPIFYEISRTLPPIPPLVQGSPTMAIFPPVPVLTNNGNGNGNGNGNNGNNGGEIAYSTNGAPRTHFMYVASGRTLRRYREGSWETVREFPHNIQQIASTNSFLYVLCAEDTRDRITNTLRRFDGNVWTDIPTTGRVWSIFAANDTLFMTTGSFNAPINQFITGSSTDPASLAGVTGRISNIAFGGGYYYFITTIPFTETSRIFRTNDFSAAQSMRYHTIRDELDRAIEISRCICPRDTCECTDCRPNVDGTERILDEIPVSLINIINLQDANNTIVTIARSGALYTVDGNVIQRVTVETRVGDCLRYITLPALGPQASGALAIWVDNRVDSPSPPTPDSRRLLLAGRQDRLGGGMNVGFTYGYMELEFDFNNGIIGSRFLEPGQAYIGTTPDRIPIGRNTPISTVTHDVSNERNANARYRSTIGERNVRYMLQAPPEVDSRMTMFASIQQDGLWSYRVRNHLPQWNGEREIESNE